MFELTKEQAMLQKMVREFATNEVEPIAEQMEKDGHIPADLYKKFGETGLLSLNIPKVRHFVAPQSSALSRLSSSYGVP